MLATGASSMDDVIKAVSVATKVNKNFVLMQCNTNYTASRDNFKHIQLNVLKTYEQMFPDMILGLSDHTSGHATVLGAVALGAKVIEKHFTDDVERDGPDHKFAVDPKSWREMVDRTRELELALGNGIKRVEDNELDTSVLQRRAVHVRRNLNAGEIIQRADLIPLRPCPASSISVFFIDKLIGRTLRKQVITGEALKWNDLE